MRIDHLPTKMGAGFTAEPIWAQYKFQKDYYPTGQFTDGGSIIFLLVFLIKQYGAHLVGFICHDIDYRYKRYSKWACDMRLLWRMKYGCGYEEMSESEIKLAGRWRPAGIIVLPIAFLYLNTFGWIAWLSHRFNDRKFYKKNYIPFDYETGFQPILVGGVEKGYKIQSITTHQETMYHKERQMAFKEWEFNQL